MANWFSRSPVSSSALIKFYDFGGGNRCPDMRSSKKLGDTKQQYWRAPLGSKFTTRFSKCRNGRLWGKKKKKVGEDLQQRNPNYDKESYPRDGLTVFLIRVDRGVLEYCRLIPEWCLCPKKERETEKRSWLQSRDWKIEKDYYGVVDNRTLPERYLRGRDRERKKLMNQQLHQPMQVQRRERNNDLEEVKKSDIPSKTREPHKRDNRYKRIKRK